MKNIISVAILLTVSLVSISQTNALTAVFFESDADTLSLIEKGRISEFLKNVEMNTIKEVKLVGYCDDLGSEGYNKTLSQKRAMFVKSQFEKYGVSAKKISHVSGNGEVGIEKNNSGSIALQRKENRRVDIEILFNMEEVEIAKVVEEVEPAVKIEPEIIKETVKVGDKITLENILFVGGHNELLPESYDELEQLAEILLSKKQYHIVVLGHVCCVYDGNDGEDLETGLFNLSLVRAETIYDYLIASGVDKSRLSYKGLKASSPTGKGDKYDRRVEIQITKIDTE